jgi:hypothetical protein
VSDLPEAHPGKSDYLRLTRGLCTLAGAQLCNTWVFCGQAGWYLDIHDDKWTTKGTQGWDGLALGCIGCCGLGCCPVCPVGTACFDAAWLLPVLLCCGLDLTTACAAAAVEHLLVRACAASD